MNQLKRLPKTSLLIAFYSLLVISLALILDTSSAQDSTTLPATVTGSVTGLNVRLSPSVSGQFITSLPDGTPVTVVGRNSDNLWLIVAVGDNGLQGWVYHTYLAINGDINALPVRTSDYLLNQNRFVDATIIEVEDGLRLRTAPDLANSQTHTRLPSYTPLNIVGRVADNTWLLIETPDGNRGWVWSAYLQIGIDVNSVPLSEEVVPIPPTSTPLPTSTPIPTTTPNPNAPTPTDEPLAESEIVNDTPATGNFGAADAVVLPQVGEDGLRLRAEPSLIAEIRDQLPSGTSLDIIGRVDDNTWVEVVNPDGVRGWVWTAYLRVTISLAEQPITGEAVVLDVASGGGGAANQYISGVTSNARRIFEQGQAMGNKANVFSKVGDSLTVATYVMYPIGWGQADLQGYAYLQPAMNWFLGGAAREGNPFATVPIAADNGWTTRDILNPALAPAGCNGETPLQCELRLNKPSTALILVGTNDMSAMGVGAFQANLARIVQICIDNGVVPVLTTIPYRHGFDVPSFNAAITTTARQYDIPLMDYGTAMSNLPGLGISSDGVHPSYPIAGDYASAVRFTEDNLNYGYTMRNLLILQMLDVLYRQVLY